MTINTREIAESYSDSWSKGWPLATESIREARQRLVWFVGIAGYLLVNGKEFWPILLGQGLGAKSFLVLAAPVVVAASCALRAYVYVDRSSTAQSTFYLAKVAAIGIAKMNEDPNDLSEVVRNEGALSVHDANVEKGVKLASRWLWTAGGLLGFALVWSLVGPLVIRAYLCFQR